MEQLERIRAMEETLQRAKELCRRLDEALDDYAALRAPVKELDTYYGSELWFFDLGCDEAGLIPADLPRGVLSEDEAYDLLCDWRALREKMLDLASEEP